MPGLATAANSHPSALLGTLRQTPGAIYLLVLLFVGLGLTSPHFLTTHNLVNIALQAAVVTIIALGMTLVILTEGIDLSLGPVLGLTGVVMGLLVLQGMPLGYALAIAVLVGVTAGTINGVLISYVEMPPFIVTLGMFGVAQSLAMVLTQGNSVTGLPPAIRWFNEG